MKKVTYKFGEKIMNIAYSSVGVAPVNTAEHFTLASNLGFNALKGDIRITKDGKLLMCHDPGITLDENGKITHYNKENSFAFLDYDREFFKKFEHSEFSDELGHNARLCDFETYIRICSENDKIAYITIRNNKIEQVVSEVLRVLEKYHMENKAIINSMTFETLIDVRKQDSEIPISYVPPALKCPSKEQLDTLAQMDNSILCFFFYAPTLCDDEHSRKLWKSAKDTIDYAKEKGIPIYMAQVGSYDDYEMLVGDGVLGFQILKPFLTDEGR